MADGKAPTPEEIKKNLEAIKKIQALNAQVKAEGAKVTAAAAALNKELDTEKDE
jgi:hypothetical protein